jgi:uncharacterized membrane protein
MATTSPKSRLAYIDWMRGLACVLMFQDHAYDSWLTPEAKRTGFYMNSRLLGGLAAPLFLFLAGVSVALVTDKLRKKGVEPNQIARTTIRRGAEIFALGLLFRLQEFVLGWPYAPWSDLLRVDILNIIGISMMLLGVLCRFAACDWLVGDRFPHLPKAGRYGAPADRYGAPSSGNLRGRTGIAAAAAGMVVALLTPPLYTTWRPRWLPWPLESYINGIHTFKEPPGWFFPMFPWAGFAFAGLALGFLLLSERARRHEAITFGLLGAGGAGIWFAARWLDHLPYQLYAVDNFWLTSPNYFLMRVAVMLVMLAGAYAWCRWGLATWGFSPMVQLGQTSLLVYWVHIEFVYGKFILLPSHGNQIGGASWGLVVVTLGMLLLSIGRTEWKKRVGKLRFGARATAGT